MCEGWTWTSKIAIYVIDADPAKENPISSQQHLVSKGLKCGPAWRREEYPKEQQSLSADSCNDWLDLVWLLSLVKSPRQKSSWQNLSNILTPLFAGCCLHSSWQPSPVQGLQRKSLLLVIVTALLAPRRCQGEETEKQGAKRIQPLEWSTHTPSHPLLSSWCLSSKAKPSKAKRSSPAFLSPDCSATFDPNYTPQLGPKLRHRQTSQELFQGQRPRWMTIQFHRRAIHCTSTLWTLSWMQWRADLTTWWSPLSVYLWNVVTDFWKLLRPF